MNSRNNPEWISHTNSLHHCRKKRFVLLGSSQSLIYIKNVACGMHGFLSMEPCVHPEDMKTTKLSTLDTLI